MQFDTRKFLLSVARAEILESDLADKAGVSRAAIHKAKTNGRAKPATIGKLAKALNVDVTEIIKQED